MKIEESAAFSTGGTAFRWPVWIRALRDDPLKGVIGLLILLKLVLPLLLHGDWEFHRDELLYLAMGDHLAWGYLEVPPMIALFGAVANFLFGTWVAGVRFVPALAGALTLWLTVRMTADLGGGRWAQLLAALGFFVGVIYLRVNVLFQPVSLDLLTYVAAAWLFLRALRDGHRHHWLWLGVLIGLGLLTKYTMLLFVGGAFIGLLLTPHRRHLTTPWPWAAALVALAIWSPNLLWQWQQGFPVVEHMSVLAQRQLDHVEPLMFVVTQLLVNLYGAPIWLIGLWWCLRNPAGADARPLFWLYVSNLAVLLLFSGKIYYLAPAYPMLLAAGAVAIEAGLLRRKAQRWLVAIPVIVVVGSLGTIPISVPILSVDGTIAYGQFGARYLGMAEAMRWEDGSIHDLPQDYADMLGWQAQAEAVAQVYEELGRGDLAASNYGQAGALVRYGPELGLPPVISKGSSFWLWGYGEATGDPMIVVDGEVDELSAFFHDVDMRGRIIHPYARERDVPISVVSSPRQSMAELWEILKQSRY